MSPMQSLSGQRISWPGRRRFAACSAGTAPCAVQFTAPRLSAVAGRLGRASSAAPLLPLWHGCRRLVTHAGAAAQDDASAGGEPGFDVPPLSASASGRRGGRPARRQNPLGYSALLSTYNATALRELAVLLVGELRLEALQARTRYTFTHKEWQATALTHASILSSFGVGCLSTSHMAMLGEDLLRLAAVELCWTALQPLEAAAVPQAPGDAASNDSSPSPSRAGASAAPKPAAEGLLSAAASTVKKLTQKLADMSPEGWGSGATGGGTDGGDEEGEWPLQCTASLLNKAAAAVAGAVPQLAEQWQIDQHMCGFGQPAGKQEKLTCCKALVAVAYLDGGYGAVRALLGPWVAELLRAAPERELQRTGHRVRRSLQSHAAGLTDDPWDAPASLGASLPSTAGAAADTITGCAASADEGGGDVFDENPLATALDVAARGQYAPLADLHWRSLLRGLRLLGGAAEGYAPRDAERFRELCDLWYSYLCSTSSTLLPPSSPASWLGAKGLERAAAVERRSAAAKALLALGGAAYGVAVSELVLERCAASQEPRLRCPAENKLRRAGADEARRERAALMQDAARLAQMEAGLGLHRPDAAAAAGGAGVYGLTPQASVGPLLTRCADGVVAAVALEGGLRRARQVVRGLVAVAEAAEVEARLQRQP